MEGFCSNAIKHFYLQKNLLEYELFYRPHHLQVRFLKTSITYATEGTTIGYILTSAVSLSFRISHKKHVEKNGIR